MRKVTRKFLNILSQHNEDAKLVKVQPFAFSGAMPNKCYHNCQDFLKANKDFDLRSGWLVGEYWGASGTAIIPHYWVYERASKSEFDVTPIDDKQTFEYILDMKVADTIDLSSEVVVPVSLKIKDDGRLLARMDVGRYATLNEFCHETVFELAKLKYED